MNLTLRKATLFFFVAAFGMAACNKYEEGPVVSLRSKKARLANTWQVDEVYDDEGEKVEMDSTSNNDATQTFEKDGGYKMEVPNFGELTGEWEFDDDKEKVIITMEFFGQTDESEYTILRLKNDELWYEDEDDYEYRMVPS